MFRYKVGVERFFLVLLSSTIIAKMRMTDKGSMKLYLVKNEFPKIVFKKSWAGPKKKLKPIIRNVRRKDF
jgi:hypothetical protein